MAILYPKGGPVKNESYTAEPTVYYALARQLSDDFVVIHSIPWLAQVAKEVDGRNVPTGEIDFLILHQTLGILALEVKGGKIHYEHNMAVLPNGDRFDPVAQVRRGIHGLSRWIFNASGSDISYRFGYGVVFPQSMVKGRVLPPALIDTTGEKPQSICFDQQDLSIIGNQVMMLMHYWQIALGNHPLSPTTLHTIVKLLLPDPDLTPTWVERIELTKQHHLLLTAQQSMRLQQIAKHPRFVLTGRSGTGKTLLAIEYARRLVSQDKRVLFLVYNVALTTAIKKELRDLHRWDPQQRPGVVVRNYHELCRFAALKLGRASEQEKGKRWYTTLAHQAFHDAIQNNLMGSYDALIIDEGQVFHKDWLTDLQQWFTSKPLLICCDETQSFSYEHKTSAEEIAHIINAPSPFTLTYNMRSPRPIFDRLEQVITSHYEQQSQRDDEQDTLQERANPDALEELHKAIKQLQTDHIPPEHIMVIYWKTSPTYRDGFEKLVGQTISVYKCRGIEAPVVIIWPYIDTIDDITWACAYSRATSRCIAIYKPITFLKHYDEYQFAKVLASGTPRLSQWIHQRKEQERQQQELREAHKKETQELRALWPSPSWQIVAFENIALQWSYSWQAWYLPKQSTQIETLLWAMHVAITSPYDVYAEVQGYGIGYLPGYRYIRKFLSSTKANKITQEDFAIGWCKTCQSWSRGQIVSMSHDSIWSCSDCSHITTQTPSYSDTNEQGGKLNLLRSAQQIVMQDSTVFSIALSDWAELHSEQQRFVEEHCQNTEESLNWVGRIITATEILALTPGSLVETAIIHRLSWDGIPWLATAITEEQWLDALVLGMRLWARYKAVRRKSKGVYEVLSLGPIDAEPTKGYV
ncbi:NERD and AAA domain-containing protein [Ktedonobacteria bacterium brp13]|nr:NERD and AAA domain-containing protein [Ktedonobacteria bacterium brp13]